MTGAPPWSIINNKKQINNTNRSFFRKDNQLIRHQRYLMYALKQAVFLLIVITTQIGCTSRNQISDLRLDSDEYNQVFDSTKDALRSAGYVLDRVDRRFGIITSQPRSAGSILEPWRDITATPAQALDASFNYEHRILRISFIPASGTTPTPRSHPDTPAPIAQIEPQPQTTTTDITSYKGTLRIDVQAIIERAHHPGRRIETTSLRKSSYTIDPSLAQRGIPAKFWEVVARDPYQEQDIMKRIVKRSQGKLEVELIDRSTKQAPTTSTP